MRRAIAATVLLLGGAIVVATALLGSVLVADLLAQPAFAQKAGGVPVHLADAQIMPSRR